MPGNTVRSGKHTYVGCIVIGAPPHSSCPMYKENMARHEKAYRSKIINSGEYGTRDNTIKRLGFQFKTKRKKRSRSAKTQKTKISKLLHLNGHWVNPVKKKKSVIESLE